MADVAAEQPRLEVEEPEATVDFSHILKLDDIDDNANEATNRRYETGESSYKFGEVVEEETVEYELEKVKPKLATHSMHCPNCKSEITKVILRRKVLAYRPAPEEPGPEQKDIVGCYSCLSLFICSDNGCFNPFDIFRKRPETSIDHEVHKHAILRSQSSDLPESSNATGDDDTMIIIRNEPETINIEQSRRSWLAYEGVLVEILKSIVYGGLMEVIVSLSLVASAAASGAATLSIVSLALASLFGGVFIIGHYIWDLRDDCYKGSSSQERNNAATNKYNEQLGLLNYFPLHVTVAILSFLVFGMVPPVVYGYSFNETNDKDFTIMVTASASLFCVLLLAILKAYINECTLSKYIKTVGYYIIIAILVSGLSYVVGNLVARFVEKLGWFDTSSGGGMPCLPRTTNPFLETF